MAAKPDAIGDAYDVVVIGSGIAGASLAYFLAAKGVTRVLVVERETQPAYHATGRSAASVVEIDTNPVVQDIKILGAEFLRRPPAGFAANPLLEERGVLVLLGAERLAAFAGDVDRLRAAGMPVQLIDRSEAVARVDGRLDPQRFAGAALLPRDGFIDVHELLSAYIGTARRAGATFVFAAAAEPVVAGGRCTAVRIGDRLVRAGVVVDAAGAWAGTVAEAAGATPLTIVPRRRCMAVLDLPDAHDLRRWPMVWHDELRVYFRDDAGRLMLCPMDEEPMPPCDVAWDEEAIAAGIERLALLAPGLRPRSIHHRWAGLRTFAPDGVPVVGWDPQRPGFFWLAGQGGCGIETSGALGAIAADLLVDRRTGRYDAAKLAPERFAAPCGPGAGAVAEGGRTK